MKHVGLWCLIVIACLPPAPAGAQTPAPASLTLAARPAQVRFGSNTSLHGRLEPAAPGVTVTIQEGDGNVVATAVTDDSGRYRVKLRPRHNLRLQAHALGAASEVERVGVRALVKVHLTHVALFGRAKVSGRVRPAVPGQKVRLRIVGGGDTVAAKKTRVEDDGHFRTRIRVTHPGRQRATARYGGPDLLAGKDRSKRRRPPLPALAPGRDSGAVRRLEGRLVALGYYLPGRDRHFDEKTRDALIAFNKIQGHTRIGSADEATWRALAHPVIARPRHRSPRRHIEIDQTRQVVMVVARGKVRWVLHTSTGANGYTHDGTYAINRKIAGYSGGKLYYPSYFDGLRAIHGWPEVPTYAASHGCARVPMWAAQWIHGLADMGMRVYVYH